MAHRQGATRGLESFYPARYGEPCGGRPGGTRSGAARGRRPWRRTFDNGQVIYRGRLSRNRQCACWWVLGAAKSFSICRMNVRRGSSPTSERRERRDARGIGQWRSALYRQGRGQGVKIEAPWVIEATAGETVRCGALGVGRDAVGQRAPQRLRLVVAQGLRYPVGIDPSGPHRRLVTSRAHTATLLPIGKVLVAGGNVSSGFSFTSELSDPATGTWSADRPAFEHRTRVHTATLLPSGKVLIAGGAQDGITCLAQRGTVRSGHGNLEPRPAAWPPDARNSHGDVAAQWQGARGRRKCRIIYLGSAELYDPATGPGAATGSLVTARDVHTATLLSSGQVFVAGGQGRHPWLSGAHAELYNPSTGTWWRPVISAPRAPSHGDVAAQRHGARGGRL